MTGTWSESPDDAHGVVCLSDDVERRRLGVDCGEDRTLGSRGRNLRRSGGGRPCLEMLRADFDALRAALEAVTGHLDLHRLGLLV